MNQPEAGTYAAPPPPPGWAPAKHDFSSFAQEAVPPSSLPEGVEPGEYWRRIVARIIDGGVLVLIVALLNLAMGESFATVVTTASARGSSSTYLMTPLGASVVLFLSFALEVVVVCLFGGQIGKLVMGLRISDARTLRAPVRWLPAVGRWLLVSLAFAMCLIPGVLFTLSPLWDHPHRRGWHDKAVNTLVTRVALRE
jgi:uncharacterized RDD family membrane protein YckC